MWARVAAAQQMPHEPNGICHEDHCYTHNVDEIANEFSFRRCFECWHVFQTPEALLGASNTEGFKHFMRDVEYDAHGLPKDVFVKAKDASEIRFCPYCGHDW